MQAGIDYFLPPVPEFDAEDERSLIDAIRVDEQDAGKETVFAANLKKALKLIRQSNSKAPGPGPVLRAPGSPPVPIGGLGRGGSRYGQLVVMQSRV